MLSGTLDAFGLPDVFQLLAITKKSGTLRISTQGSDGRVEFRQGEIAYAVSDTRRMPLAARLLGGGLVNDAQLRQLVAAQRGGAAALSTALLDDGVLDEETFDIFVREQIQDAVFELMRLEEGSFAFDGQEDDEVPEEGAVRLTVSTESLITEGLRRLKEWPDIQDHVVTSDAVVTIAPQPPSDSVQVSMDAEQWRLLTFVDGRRTVRDLVDLTGQGEWTTCQVIAGLVVAGLVEVVDPAAGGRTGVSELVARHDLLRRLEERELSAGGGQGNGVPSTPAQAALAGPLRTAPPEGSPQPRPAADLPAPMPSDMRPVRPVPSTPPPEGRSPVPEQRPAPAPVSTLDGSGPGPDEPRRDRPPEKPPPADPREVQSEADTIVDFPAVEDPAQRAHHNDSTDAFDREEVERELASLGFRDEMPEDDPDEDEPAQNPFRINRSEDVGRGLLHRLIDVRKHP
ncbi:MAG: DUF4388 domain-containing protein [Nitriliruptorales bacterium]|nr:DUF4388 domain-containing protein [Nitriliruptorales bacterium]